MDPRKQRTIDALLRAAEEIFTARAAADVTVEEIAGRAGVAVGSIYNHFGSKEALYAALLEHALETFEGYMDEEIPPDLTPVEQILDLICQGCARLRGLIEIGPLRAEYPDGLHRSD